MCIDRKMNTSVGDDDSHRQRSGLSHLLMAISVKVEHLNEKHRPKDGSNMPRDPAIMMQVMITQWGSHQIEVSRINIIIKLW